MKAHTYLSMNNLITNTMVKNVQGVLWFLFLSLLVAGCSDEITDSDKDDVYIPIADPEFPSEYYEPDMVMIGGELQAFDNAMEARLRAEAKVAANNGFDAYVGAYGQLRSVVGDNMFTMDSLAVHGPINALDLNCIKECVMMGKLRSVNLSDAVIEGNRIPDYAFLLHHEGEPTEGTYPIYMPLYHVDLPKGITEIGRGAFAYTLLTDVKIPSSVTVLEYAAFIQNIFMEGTLVIGDGVREICDRCFCNAYGVSRIVVPGSVKDIGWGAFRLSDCSKIKDLREVRLDEGLESIANDAFYGNMMYSLVVPKSLKECAGDSFGFVLLDLYICADTPPTVCALSFMAEMSSGGWPFGDPNHIPNVYVPEGSIDKYKAAKGWNELDLKPYKTINPR